ncbi:transcription repressor OFP13-like [Phalaenopsis equestris]|uniref:transcription repressor OFP13-like n=1 Tax=Phalaenopsis equestris TaxID=78828 RepID=UPI0009E5BB3C|nr:transcription repressor OFP13-like [Phalaenopsis equestris]
MGRKKLMSFSSLLFSYSSSSPCIWPPCTKPKTSSFRLLTSPLLPISTSSQHQASETFSFSDQPTEKTCAEAVLDGLRSDRLFFDPCCSENSSIMAAGFHGGLAVEKESTNPYRDFRASMEEMVEAHGDRNWEWLQQMLVWFLRANGKGNHGLIVGAFIDLLLGFGASSPSSSSPLHDKNPICSSCSSNSSFMFDIDGDGVERYGNC